MTRIDLTKKLTCPNGELADPKLFEEYVGKHYAEVYTFFSIMKECLLDISKVEFDEPITVQDGFIISFSLPSSDFKILKTEVAKNVTYEYLKQFDVEVKGKATNAKMIFTHI